MQFIYYFIRFFTTKAIIITKKKNEYINLNVWKVFEVKIDVIPTQVPMYKNNNIMYVDQLGHCKK